MKTKKQAENSNEASQKGIQEVKKMLNVGYVKDFLVSLKTDRKKLTWTVVIVVLVISLGSAAYFYKQLYDLKKDPQKVAQAEADALIAKVSKLIELPQGEKPTIATVTDPEKLRDQAFFDNAKRGDKVLIYTNAGKAILYDPSQNKIIEVAPISIGSQPNVLPPEAVPSK